MPRPEHIVSFELHIPQLADVNHRLEIIMASLEDLTVAFAALETAQAAEIAELNAIVTAYRAEHPAIDFSPLVARVNALASSLNQATSDARAAVPDAGEPVEPDPVTDPAPVDPTPDPEPVPDPVVDPEPVDPSVPVDPSTDPSVDPAPTDPSVPQL